MSIADGVLRRLPKSPKLMKFELISIFASTTHTCSIQ